MESAIDVYTQRKKDDYTTDNDLTQASRRFCPNELVRKVSLTRFKLLNSDSFVLDERSKFCFEIHFEAKEEIKNAYFKITFSDTTEQPVATAFSSKFDIKKGENKLVFHSDLSALKAGLFGVSGAIIEKSSFDIFSNFDNVERMCYVEIPQDEGGFLWARRRWGKVKLPDLEMGGVDNG